MGVYQKNLFLPSYIYSRSRFQSPQRNLRNLPRHYFYILFHASTNRYILGKKKCQEKFTLLWCCCYQEKILERIGQISAKFTLGPVPPSDNPSLGFHSLMFHFDGVCGVSPGRRFATRFIGRLFIFARFCQSRRGGRPIPGCRSLS